MQTTHAYRGEPDAARAPALLSQRWCWNYILGALTFQFLAYLSPSVTVALPSFVGS